MSSVQPRTTTSAKEPPLHLKNSPSSSSSIPAATSNKGEGRALVVQQRGQVCVGGGGLEPGLKQGWRVPAPGAAVAEKQVTEGPAAAAAAQKSFL